MGKEEKKEGKKKEKKKKIVQARSSSAMHRGTRKWRSLQTHFAPQKETVKRASCTEQHSAIFLQGESTAAAMRVYDVHNECTASRATTGCHVFC